MSKRLAFLSDTTPTKVDRLKTPTILGADGRPMEGVKVVDTTEADETEEGLAALFSREALPDGSNCRCGALIPWDRVRATASDLSVEIEVQHHCGARYTLRAGRIWEAA